MSREKLRSGSSCRSSWAAPSPCSWRRRDLDRGAAAHRRRGFTGDCALGDRVARLAGRAPRGCLPALVIVNVAIWFLVILWNRDRELPLFEVGDDLRGIHRALRGISVVRYLQADGLWTAASDRRLRTWAPGTLELGRYAWGSVAYIAGLAGAYLAVRGRATAARRTAEPSFSHRVDDRRLAVPGAAHVLRVALGVVRCDLQSVVPDVELGQVGLARDLPYVLQQISHNALGILSILKLCAIAYLLHRWSSMTARVVLIVWLTGEVTATVFRMGARTGGGRPAAGRRPPLSPRSSVRWSSG